MPRWVIMATVIGLVFGMLAPTHCVKASDGERFGIFYTQHVNPEYDISVLHDALTGQEIVCTRTKGDNSSPSCYLTGRTWK